MKKKLFNWQKLMLYILAIITFIAYTANYFGKALNTSYFLDTFIGVCLNVFILWLVFKICNWIYLKYKK
jgi:lipopolysaccharide export LptBFGC system permease protein LptF